MGSATDVKTQRSNFDSPTGSRTNFGTFVVPPRSDSTTVCTYTQEPAIYISVRSSMIPTSSVQYASIFSEADKTRYNSALHEAQDDEQTLQLSASKEKLKNVEKSHWMPSLSAKTRGHLSAFNNSHGSVYEKAKLSASEFFKWGIPKQIYHSIQPDLETGLSRHYAFSFLSVSYRSPTTLLMFLAILYSYIPIFIFFLIFTWLLFNGGLMPFFSVCIFTVVGLINELCLKNLFRQPRPESSLVQSYGMPSSHCIISYSFLIWGLLEAIFAAHIQLFPFWLIFFAMTAFVPVPWARYYLEDHTIMQCVAGCLGAIPFGVLTFFLRTTFYSTAAVTGSV